MGVDANNQNLHHAPNAPREIPPEWDEPPPFLESWNRVYLAVVIYTCVLIVSLYVLTIMLNR